MENYRKRTFLSFSEKTCRSSNAGFPTKLAESMAVGTPVITNATGSIAKYLTNAKNGFLIETTAADELLGVFHTILALKEADYRNMRLESRKMAEKSFDYRRYIEQLSKFFSGRE